MSRIGIFGGSFNPPHLGHILALSEFREKLSLDAVLMIPAAIPPHKTLSANTPPPEVRLQLCRLAVQELPFVTVSDLELRREGKSYTADTLELLRRQYPTDDLFLLMGTDMLLSFENWHQPERIARQATLAVAHRNQDDARQLRACVRRLEQSLSARTLFVENSFLPHSSTSVRAMLAFRLGEAYLAPAVLQYIRQEGLYYSGEDLHTLPLERLTGVSLSLHKQSRVAHVLGCSRTAEALAKKYREDAQAAARAGILHDITKALNAAEQLKICDTYDIILSNFDRNHPKLLHPITGAVIAERIFGENKAVCQAIRWHTTGKAAMTTLEKIVYLADYMEPNRTFAGVERLRSLTERSLDEALLLGLQMTTEQLRLHQAEIGPCSLAALRFLEERKESL